MARYFIAKQVRVNALAILCIYAVI
jgi:hypothetical protein